MNLIFVVLYVWTLKYLNTLCCVQPYYPKDNNPSCTLKFAVGWTILAAMGVQLNKIAKPKDTSD